MARVRQEATEQRRRRNQEWPALERRMLRALHDMWQARRRRGNGVSGICTNL